MSLSVPVRFSANLAQTWSLMFLPEGVAATSVGAAAAKPRKSAAAAAKEAKDATAAGAPLPSVSSIPAFGSGANVPLVTATKSSKEKVRSHSPIGSPLESSPACSVESLEPSRSSFRSRWTCSNPRSRRVRPSRDLGALSQVVLLLYTTSHRNL